jgi:LysM repeat protein
MGVKRFIVLLSFLFGALFAQAQENYVRHTVQQGETVYSIAKAYNISEQDLIRVNPDAMNGLRVGTILIIPNKTNKPRQRTEQVIVHVVQPKETLYGLSKQYNCTVEELLALNPELKDGLQIGMEIQVPKKAKPEAVNAVVDSAKYTYQKVEPKETVYSICRAAGISEEEFLALNPEVAQNGLQIGMTIRLPKEQKPTDAKEENVVKEVVPVDQPSRKKPYDLYRVGPDDNLASIAHQFFCTEKELITLNPELANGLTPGRYIVVPVKEPKISKPLANRDIYPPFWNVPTEEDKAPAIHIAVLLPLYFSANDSLELFTEEGLDIPIYNRSKIGLQFLTGVQLALDSLAGLGYNIELDVYDTQNSTTEIDKIATKISDKTQLIIGPLYSKNAEHLARLLPNKTIISPLSKTLDNKSKINLIDGVNYVDATYAAMAQLINKRQVEHHILFLNVDTTHSRDAFEKVMAQVDIKDSANFSYVWVDREFSRLNSLDSYLVPGKPNSIVVVDQNAAFLSDLLRKVNKRKDTSLYVIGTSKIFEIPTLENRYLNNLNLAAISSDYINVEDTCTELFISKFRSLAGTEPNRFGYAGYDTGLYFAQLLAHSTTLPAPVEWPKWQGLQKGFEFQQEPGRGGVNTFVFKLALRDYKLVPVEQ